MLVTLFAAAAFAAAAQAPAAIFPPREPPTAVADAAADCPSLAPRYADGEDWIARSRPRRLIELPPGRLELAVHREVDGCPIPAVLREGIGGSRAPSEGERRR